MLAEFKRFLKDEDGNASMEFAILFPFFMFIFVSIVELGFITTRAILLERGVDMAGREVRLELIPNLSHSTLRDRICLHSTILTNCKSDLFVELQGFDENAAFPQNQAECRDRSDEDDLSPKTNFSPGLRSEIMFIRACMIVDPLVPGLGIGLGLPRASGGGHQLVSFTAFMNEPS